MKLKFTEKANRKTYKITAKTLTEACEQLEKHRSKTGGWGQFSWNWKSSVKGKPKAPPTELGIQVDWTIELPEWQGVSKQPKVCEVAWKVMLKALAAHEEEHLELMRKSIKQLEKDLKKNPPQTQKDALAAADDWADAHSKGQKKFDEKADHGQKDGVQLDLTEEGCAA